LNLKTPRKREGEERKKEREAGEELGKLLWTKVFPDPFKKL